MQTCNSCKFFNRVEDYSDISRVVGICNAMPPQFNLQPSPDGRGMVPGYSFPAVPSTMTCGQHQEKEPARPVIVQ